MSEETCCLICGRQMGTAACDCKEPDIGPVNGLNSVSARQKPDMVNHPEHYKRGGIEVIDVIDALEFDFYDANAFKYLARAGHKKPEGILFVASVDDDIAVLEKEIEDRGKSIWYQQRKLDKKKAALAKLRLTKEAMDDLKEKMSTPEGRRSAINSAVASYFGYPDGKL